MIDDINRQILEYGDYQTPDDFVKKVCKYLREEIEIKPRVIIEPTFGLGNFITGALEEFKELEKVYGVEINEDYYTFTNQRVKENIKDSNIVVELYNENIFTFDFEKIKSNVETEEQLLIIGNPPWVTNSELTTIESMNLPVKENFKGLSGLDAITGKGNFDIAEYIILQLLNEFKDYKSCYVAMLCKNIVGRNIVRDLQRYNFNLSEIKMITFNALTTFGVNCEAGLLVMKIGGEKRLICDVYDFDNTKEKIRSFGWVDNNFISDIGNYTDSIDGKCQFEWRQGIKHDCSKVMELSIRQDDKTYINGYKQVIDVEDDYIYPLLKSSDIKQYISTQENTRKNLIVTQKRVGEETNSINNNSPKLWRYLEENSQYLDNRKSTIYKKAPRFAIFGVGDYSYRPYKVGISGFYKNPLFTLAYNDVEEEKSIMFDDTCYILGFEEYNDALITMLIMNSSIVQEFLKSIAFIDSKRPYTKEVLKRIDLVKATTKISYQELLETANRLGIPISTLTQESYTDYKESIRVIEQEFSNKE